MGGRRGGGGGREGGRGEGLLLCGSGGVCCEGTATSFLVGYRGKSAEANFGGFLYFETNPVFPLNFTPLVRRVMPTKCAHGSPKLVSKWKFQWSTACLEETWSNSPHVAPCSFGEPP